MRSSREALAGTLEAPRRNSRTGFAAVAVALVMSVTLNVLLAHKIRSFNDVQTARMAERLLNAGATVLPITGRRLDGRREVISYQGTNQPTVLYVFTPPYKWCARKMDNFKRLVDKGSGQYRFVGLSLSDEGLAQHVAKNDLNLPVYSGLSTEAKQAYKLSGTPQTIVVSPESRVLQNWMGAYVGSQKSEIEAFFHVSLPGLRELPRSDATKN